MSRSSVILARRSLKSLSEISNIFWFSTKVSRAGRSHQSWVRWPITMEKFI